MPAGAESNSSMQQLINVRYSTGEQHKEVNYARVASDAKDTEEVLVISKESIHSWNLSKEYRNWSYSTTTCNVHESKSIAKHILASMEGNPGASYIFRKKDQAITMDTKSTIKMQDEYVHVDPQLLFQRLLTVGTKNGELQMSSITNSVTIPQLCLSQSMQFDQPQNPVWQMLCGVLRLKNFLDHLKQFNMSKMVQISCIVSIWLYEPHMTIYLSNTVRMSLGSKAEQLLCLMGTVTNQGLCSYEEIRWPN